MRWKYILQPSQTITFAFFDIGDGSSQPDNIGYVLNEFPTINNRHDYQRRFRIESTRESSTLIIGKVTQREEAIYQCRLQIDSTTWAYNVRIDVTGNKSYEAKLFLNQNSLLRISSTQLGVLLS